MSRSVKRTPRCGDKKNKYFKQYANRKLRRKDIQEESLQYKTYKKNFCSYDICDYEEVGLTFEQFYRYQVKQWHSWRKYYNEPYPSKEKKKKKYLKWYIRK